MVACRTEAQWRDVAGYKCASKRGGEHVDVQVRFTAGRKENVISLLLSGPLTCRLLSGPLTCGHLSGPLTCWLLSGP